MANQRTRTRARLQEAIKRELSLILEFEARDPRLQAVNVTAVRLSKDLKRAIVFLDIADDHEEVLELCRRDRGFFRSELAKRLDLRHTPALDFKLDEGLQRTADR